MNNDNKTNINWYPGHMAKTKNEVKSMLNLIDVVLEIIDARIPDSSKNKEIDKLICSKPRILIMTKYDLCDKQETNRWVSYYESLGYRVICLDLVNNSKLDELYDEINKVSAIIEKKRLEKGLKGRRVRALVLGIPNVGKSTLINRMVGKKVTNVGNKPGITKKLEWIRVSNEFELLDTPGILWPKLENEEIALNLASMMAIKEEILDNEEVAIHIIKKMVELYPQNFKNRYGIDKYDDIVSVLDAIGKKIGAIRNNETDYEKVYNRVLSDLRDGYLGKVTFDKYLLIDKK